MEILVIGKRRSNLFVVGLMLAIAASLLLVWAIAADMHWAAAFVAVLFLLGAGALIIQNIIIPEALIRLVGEARIACAFPKRRFNVADVEAVDYKTFWHFTYGTVIFRMKDGAEYKQKHVGQVKTVVARLRAQIDSVE